MAIDRTIGGSKQGNNGQAPMVTVIMPTYNHAAFIGEAIDSVLCQSYPHFELIIIDNFSKDNTEDIVKSYPDTRIRYYKFNNRGIIAASRNYGIRLSHGKYVAFIDSDDIWYPAKLEKQIALMQKNPDIALCYVLYTYLFRNGKLKGVLPDPGKRFRGDIFNQLYLFNPIANSGTMVKRSVLEEVGLLDEDPKLVGVEDADLWLRITRKKPVDYVDKEVLLAYRVGGNNIFYRKLFEKLRRRLYLAKKFSIYSGKQAYFKRILLVHSQIFFKKLFSLSSEDF